MADENTRDFLFECLTGVRESIEQEQHGLDANGSMMPFSLPEVCRLMRVFPYALELQPTPPELKAQVLAAIAADQDVYGKEFLSHPPLASHAEAKALLYVQRSNEGSWIDSGVNGVTLKKLFVDHDTGYATMLVRMAPDSWFPMHHHAGYEECFMLQGNVSSGEIELSAGDYQRMSGGTMHQALHSKEGCLFLVVASEHNELVLP